jgi:hypothetical protein
MAANAVSPLAKYKLVFLGDQARALRRCREPRVRVLPQGVRERPNNRECAVLGTGAAHGVGCRCSLLARQLRICGTAALQRERRAGEAGA